MGCHEIFRNNEWNKIVLNKFKVEHGIVVRDGDGSKVSVLEYWNHANGEDVSPEGLQMLGFAIPFLEIENLVLPRLRIGLRTEVGNFLIPINFAPNSDHYVISNFWTPISDENVNTLKTVLDGRRLSSGQELDISDFLYLTNAANNLLIELKYESEVLDSFQEYILDSSIGENLAFKPYDYQLTGMKWLGSLFDQRIGGLLCDEMGLGKTIQAIGLIEKIRRNNESRVLICVPNSLIVNWSREFKKFAPQLDFHIYLGPDRFLQPHQFDRLKVILTTYDLLVRDFSIFNKTIWDSLICDEAQFLKNHESQRSQAILSINAVTKFLLTGTPVENSLKDLWTLSNIVYPGILGTQKSFYNLVDDNPIHAFKIGKGISPLVKRRRVKDVLKDLPEITSIDHAIQVNREFALAYDDIRLRRAAITAGADPRTVFLRLRQFCCHPDLVGKGDDILEVPKFQRLNEIMFKIADYDEKVIIFSSFLHSMDILISYCQVWFPDVWIGTIDGVSTPSSQSRMDVIDAFSAQPGFAILVINPEAGGIGLNITAANHVIHFNLLWNPSKEAQATARVYRPGQSAEHVFVHRLFYANTVEDRMNRVLEFKRDLADASMEHPENKDDIDFIEDALQLSPLSDILASTNGGSSGNIY
jgi:SNF2 family DNA or RNA helicase